MKKVRTQKAMEETCFILIGTVSASIGNVRDRLVIVEKKLKLCTMNQSRFIEW